MARIRSAKPEFWSDPVMCALPRDVRFTFKGIWEACADDFGRFLADARVIKGTVWPMDDDISLKKIEQFVTALAECGRIVLYKVHGVRYGYVLNWSKHQRVSHPTPSRFPDPPSETLASNSGNTREEFQSDSAQSGADRSGEEWNRSGAEEEFAPLISVELPAGAMAFMAMFYEPAFTTPARERYRNVLEQLAAALRPGYPGPVIRGGIRVKARSADHLERECRAVMADPPMDRDKAIVIVLKRLTNPEPGPTPAEQHKAETTATIREEEAYQRAANEAGIAWAKEHPSEYKIVIAEVDAGLRGAGESAFSKMARAAALTQKCAKAAGFPDFETWQRERAA